MAIPDYQEIMLPLLKFSSDKLEHSLREAYEKLATILNISIDEQKIMLPSGNQEVFNNRVAWARTYLKMAGLLQNTKRGYFKITDRGLETLDKNLTKIDNSYLEQFAEFQEFKTRKRKIEKTSFKSIIESKDSTPEEMLESAYQDLRNELANDILKTLKECSPSLFEKIVVELLVKMGYGGSRKDAGKAIGKSGDEGIDGIIKEDKLGLDIIYIQAKKWENTVSRPEIQKFAGALQGQRARKGIFITTSNFSKEAHSYATNIDNKIVLIDGDQLSQLMIDSDLGVSKISSYDVKKIDSDYFIEE